MFAGAQRRLICLAVHACGASLCLLSAQAHAQNFSHAPLPIALRSLVNHDNWVVDAHIGDVHLPFPLSIDLGSATTGVISEGCARGCQALTPRMAIPVRAQAENVVLEARYGDGAYGWTGLLAPTTLALEGLAPVPLQVGAIIDNTLFSEDGLARGILGLGPTDLLLAGTQSMLQQWQAAQTQAEPFALQLCNPNGRLWLGGIDPAQLRAPMQYTPLYADGFWRIAPMAMQLGTHRMALPAGEAGGMVVDNGIDEMRLPPVLYRAMTESLAATPAFVQAFGADFATDHSRCRVPRDGSDPQALQAALPALGLTFPSSDGADQFEVTLPATQSYLSPLRSSRGEVLAYCNRLAVTYGPLTFSSPYWQALVVQLDPARGRLGLAPHVGCD